MTPKLKKRIVILVNSSAVGMNVIKVWLVNDMYFMMIILTVSNAMKIYFPTLAKNVTRSLESSLKYTQCLLFSSMTIFYFYFFICISRTCHTMESTGIKLVSNATSVECCLLTNNLDQRLRRFTVEIAMICTSRLHVMVVKK